MPLLAVFPSMSRKLKLVLAVVAVVLVYKLVIEQ
jgi:hypothetical protein